ncbi:MULTISPECIES: hypothetical protein [unclassified Bradyrhizobium]|uniref:hypothetical protein n=1 Tax=unclassified Bradyrhizobium TaxID=2631580 RepID=UPI0028E383F2|nr:MULTISPECIES: hypothetical protein [unclassified Bradyrhizobium]
MIVRIEMSRIEAAAVGRRARAAAAWLIAALSLAGCASSGVMPSEAERFGNTYNYLPVNDVPRDEQRPVLTWEEREKLRKELVAARDHQTPANAKQDRK